MKIFVSSAEVEKSWRQRKSGRVEDFILMGTSLTARRFIFVPAVDSGGQAEPWTAVRGHRRSTSGQRVKFRVVKRERGERTTSSGSFLFTASTFDSCFPNFTSHQLWMLWMVLPTRTKTLKVNGFKSKNIFSSQKTLKRLHAHEHLLAFHCAQQHISLHMYVCSLVWCIELIRHQVDWCFSEFVWGCFDLINQTGRSPLLLSIDWLLSALSESSGLLFSSGLTVDLHLVLHLCIVYLYAVDFPPVTPEAAQLTMTV